MEDRVILSGLRLVGRHGVTAAEQEQPQGFRVDIECPVDARAAAVSDDLGATLDYRRLSDCATAIIGGPPRRLIETLADDLAARVLADIACAWVRVRVTKLRPGSIDGEATVEVTRTRVIPSAGTASRP